MTELMTLLKRVDEAEGTDRCLARAIQCTIGGWHRVEPRHTKSKHGAYIAPCDWLGAGSDGCPILDGLHGTDMHRDVPDCTTSLDAAVSLVEEVLPKAWWNIGREGGASIGPEGVGSCLTFEKAATPPLALCAALIRAKIETDNGHD